jgi:GNAT superfamily N-acetyltransferase
MYSVKIASTNQQLNSILKLRYEVLRKPWSQTIDSATDQLEEKSINAFIQNNKGVYIACGRLQENENKIGQIRFMAVDQNYQGKGLGKLIITSLEEKAKDLQLNKIQLQAYTPLLRGKKFNDPRLISLGKKYGKTPAQIILRWAIQQEISSIPKSSNINRLMENFDIFNFSIEAADIIFISSFDEQLRIIDDPMPMY